MLWSRRSELGSPKRMARADSRVRQFEGLFLSVSVIGFGFRVFLVASFVMARFGFYVLTGWRS